MPALLTTTTFPFVGGELQFVFTVPGHQRWTLRSVRATVTRGAGGTPNRAYTLTVDDGTNNVAVVGAQDAGTDPGSCSVTWTNAPAAAVAVGGDGVVVAPLGPIVLPAGYHLTGDIVGPVAGDQWESAVAWYDYVNV